MAGMTALPLQQFIASLDQTCLPKIIQVCSGVYFQGSVYEISGSEVSFSTGDLLKVTAIELLSVCCEDIQNQEKFELPINHTGLFKVFPDEMPYNTVEELLSLRPVGLDSCLPFTFTSRSKITLGNLTLGAGKALTVISIERHEGQEDQVRCHVEGQQEVSAEVCIPLSSRGEFYECEGEERFTLQEIMSSPSLQSRKFRYVNTAKCERTLVLSPVYQVHAIMSLRKNVLKFPSSLEVDVVDVTEHCKDVEFVSPLSLTEVFSQPDESFPAVVEILETPSASSMLKCKWLSQLVKFQHLILHQKATLPMVLLSTLRGRKVQQYFMVSQHYGGRFRRRPREFSSVYELYAASIQAPGLRVSVTRNCEEVEEEGLPALSVGEQLEIVRCDRLELPSAGKEKQSVEALLCRRLQDPDDGDDDDDEEEDDGAEKDPGQEETNEVLLPLYMQGHFVEVLRDNKKYKLRDLGREFCLPLDVKVVSRDAELEADPLVGLPCLRIEAAMLEPTLQASFPATPEHCFEIPVQWLSMSMHFTKKALPWPPGEAPRCRVERVTEVTDTFFYEFCKQGDSAAVPPPRPPKQKLSTDKQSKKKSSKAEKDKRQKDKSVSAKQWSDTTLDKKRRPAPPPPANAEDEPPPIVSRKHDVGKAAAGKALPNTYVKMEESMKKVSLCEVAADVDSDHDYELVEDTLSAMMRSAPDAAMFY
ncbi:protein THEMIS2 [Salarias fasciatus]|uniref:protein THEMIS2 n=1 Tax=Salarias fasciatus TaxID=181472 RepID=UPI0011767C26|nr:protein THEMIS2 [Salarias fasciatus]